MIRVNRLLTALRRTATLLLGLSGLLAGAAQALPHQTLPPERAALETRVKLVREALNAQGDANNTLDAERPERVAQWLNWPNWNNWANWNNWNNWRNWGNWLN